MDSKNKTEMNSCQSSMFECDTESYEQLKISPKEISPLLKKIETYNDLNFDVKNLSIRKYEEKKFIKIENKIGKQWVALVSKNTQEVPITPRRYFDTHKISSFSKKIEDQSKSPRLKKNPHSLPQLDKKIMKDPNTRKVYMQAITKIFDSHDDGSTLK